MGAKEEGQGREKKWESYSLSLSHFALYIWISFCSVHLPGYSVLIATPPHPHLLYSSAASSDISHEGKMPPKQNHFKEKCGAAELWKSLLAGIQVLVE